MSNQDRIICADIVRAIKDRFTQLDINYSVERDLEDFLMDNITNFVGCYSDLESKIRYLEDENSDYEYEINELEDEIESLEKDLKSANETIEELENEIKELEDDI